MATATRAVLLCLPCQTQLVRACTTCWIAKTRAAFPDRNADSCRWLVAKARAECPPFAALSSACACTGRISCGTWRANNIPSATGLDAHINPANSRMTGQWSRQRRRAHHGTRPETQHKLPGSANLRTESQWLCHRAMVPRQSPAECQRPSLRHTAICAVQGPEK